jgi:hypothetical protein
MKVEIPVNIGKDTKQIVIVLNVVPDDGGERRGVVGVAEKWLKDFLDAGRGEQLASECIEKAKQAGISEKTLRKAKKRLGVQSGKIGNHPVCEWSWKMVNTEITHGTHGQ